MANFKIELKEEIKFKDKLVVSVQKVDDFLNRVIQFVLSFTPEWFKLMEWLALSGAFLYVFVKYKLFAFDFLFAISLLLILFYIVFSLRKQFIFIEKYTQKHAFLDLFMNVISFVLLMALLFALFYIIFGLVYDSTLIRN